MVGQRRVIVERIGEDPCIAHGIAHVQIQDASDTSVSFSTRSEDLTGDPDERLLRTFTVPRSEVYTGAVTGNPPVALVKGQIGTLYLTRAGWDATASGGYRIHGVRWAVLKEPNCAAAARVLTELAVVPSSIAVRGHLEGETEFFDIELIGPDAAESQAITWNGADYIDLRLSQRGARRLRVKSRSTTVRFWPVRIHVTGAPQIDPVVSGEVDLLDIEMADHIQKLVYAKPGDALKLVLSPDGVTAFHVTPQLVAERTGQFGRVVRQCQGCAETGHERARKRASRVVRRRASI